MASLTGHAVQPSIDNAGYRGRCECGWSSASFTELADLEKAVGAHLRQASRADFDALIERSSIGVALADVKARGIDAHLADLERSMRPRRRVKKGHRAKNST